MKKYLNELLEAFYETRLDIHKYQLDVKPEIEVWIKEFPAEKYLLDIYKVHGILSNGRLIPAQLDEMEELMGTIKERNALTGIIEVT